MAEPHEPDSPAAAFDDAEKAAGAVSSDGRPVIQWNADELTRCVDSAEAALMQARADVLFQRGPTLVRVVRRRAMSVRMFKRPAGGLGITMVDQAYMIEQMTRAAAWEKWDQRSNGYKRCGTPEKVAATYLARSGHWKLPHLLAAISTPTLRPDGTLLQEPGYDTDTATWYDPCGVEFPRVPERPTQKQAKAAADVLLSAFGTIPFVGGPDISVAVSLMLTALVRRSLPSAPIGCISSPTPGSGKTLIADCFSILATGVSAAAMQFPATDEEAEKVALSVLMDGHPVVLIDNIERPLQGAWLCSVLTSETHQGRLLGRNEMISVPTTTLWLATGNKLIVQGDLRRRALLCRIDPKHENPQELSFKTDLREEFTRRRVELVIAGLTLIRAYLVGGERAGVFREWGSFEQWSKFCREPLMWLGMNDPCDSYALIAQEDPERQEHLQMIAAWRATFGEKPTTAAEAIAASVLPANCALQDALNGVAKDRSGAMSSKKLAGWLRSRDGRIAAGSMFQRASETRDHVTLWKTTKVEN